MKTLWKAVLVAGVLALPSLAVSPPAAAQGFGFTYDGWGGSGAYVTFGYPYHYQPYYAPYYPYAYGRPYYYGRSYYGGYGRPYGRGYYGAYGRPYRGYYGHRGGYYGRRW